MRAITRTIGLSVAGLMAFVLAFAAHGLEGAEVYKEKCAKCHGESGRGDTPTGKSMKVSSMVGDEKVQNASEAELIQAIRQNKKHKEPVKKASDAELQAVIPHIKKLASGQ